MLYRSVLLPAASVFYLSQAVYSVRRHCVVTDSEENGSRLEKRQRLEEDAGVTGPALYSWADLPAGLLLKMFEILATLPDGRNIVSASRTNSFLDCFRTLANDLSLAAHHPPAGVP